MFQIEGMVRGYHYYKDIWEAVIGEELECEREHGNIHDLYAVAVKQKSGVTVGHLPKRISSVCSLFLRRGGLIWCTVSGSRRYSSDLEQGGLEIPCTITFDIGSNDSLEKKAEKLVKSALTTSSAKPNSTIAEGNSDNGPEPKKRKLDEPWDDTNWEYEIKNGHMLTNSSINMAQDILKKQFPAIKGLISTIDQYQTPAADGGVNQLQIFHCRSRAHWIAASSIGSVDSVNVY